MPPLFGASLLSLSIDREPHKKRGTAARLFPTGSAARYTGLMLRTKVSEASSSNFRMSARPITTFATLALVFI